jgi:meiotic recombination protein DMC1
VDELQSQGINVQDINKLKAAGICTVLSVSQTTRRNLLKIKGLSEAKVEKLKEAATKMLPPTFATAAEIGLRREVCVMITTGSKNVDAMLGGKTRHRCRKHASPADDYHCMIRRRCTNRESD